MEEVDQIILHSFENIGCDFVDGLESLKQLTTENVVEATVRCLRIINPDFKMSHVFPPGMSARFRIGSSIAQACQNAGYRDNIGYQTFLYSSEVDIRKIFMFLVEKLPRKEGIKEDETIGSTSVLKRRIGQVLREQFVTVWLPAYCKQRRCNIQFRTEKLDIPEFNKTKNQPGDADKVSFVHEQVSNHEALVPSLLELNANGVANVHAATVKKELVNKKPTKKSFQWKKRTLVPDELSLSSTFDEVIQSMSGQTSQSKQSRFAHAKKLQFTTTEPTFQSLTVSKPSIPKKPKHLTSATSSNNNQEAPDKVGKNTASSDQTDQDDAVMETEEERHEGEELQLKAMITQAEEDQERHKEELSKMEIEIKEMKLEISEMEGSNEEEKEKLTLQEKTIHLLPNAEENIEKLKTLIEKNSQRLIGLGKLWEERRVPLIEEIRVLKREGSVTQSDVENKLEEMKVLRSRMKETSEETRRKEQLIKQLTTELESMKRDISRQSYTRRILEIVASIHKQQLEVQRVIGDTKEVQKQINQMRGRIDRTFSAADEIIFKDAKKDDNVRQAYKYLVSLHDGCNALVQTVENTGAIMREIRELESQIDIESNKNAEENLAKIMKDFKEMKRENSELMKQLKER